mmetsp:Transcript_27958/g.60147  ORF Transcript_27958/g.60147 Transcript_27958/m.60147 type:complete len:98 (-) Transcript_27958:257-550(-)
MAVAQLETYSKGMTTISREWLGKCHYFLRATMVVVNMYVIIISCYSTVMAPLLSFAALMVMGPVGDRMTPFHPQVAMRIIASSEVVFGGIGEIVVVV